MPIIKDPDVQRLEVVVPVDAELLESADDLEDFKEITDIAYAALDKACAAAGRVPLKSSIVPDMIDWAVDLDADPFNPDPSLGVPPEMLNAGLAFFVFKVNTVPKEQAAA